MNYAKTIHVEAKKKKYREKNFSATAGFEPTTFQCLENGGTRLKGLYF